MAKIEDNTKRRSNELEEQSVTPRPPPKKRFLSRASSPDEEESDNEDTSDPFKEPLEAFRKDAIIRQWKDYTRSFSRWKKNIEQVELRLNDKENMVEIWQDSFKKLQTVLSNLVQEGLLTFENNSSLMDVNNNNFHNLIKEEWATEYTSNMTEAYKRKDHFDLTLAKLNQLMEIWIMKRENTTRDFHSVFEYVSKDVQNEHATLLSIWIKNQKVLQDLKFRYNSSNFKYLMLTEELRILNDRLKFTEENIRQAKLELEKVELENKIKHQTPTNTLSKTSTQLTQSEGSSGSSNSTTITTTTTTTAAAAMNAATATTTFNNNSQDPLAHIQHILNQRLRDIQLINDDRISLKQQIALLEMDLVSVPESRIYKAPICRQLSQSRAYYKDRCNRISDIHHDLQLNLEDLTYNRRRLIRDLDNEQANHFKDLQDQLRKLDVDLTRIRAQRDALQMTLEERKAANEAGRASILELKLIADTRKEHIHYLESEVLRLQRKSAARTGNRKYYELWTNTEDENTLQPLENELNQLTEQFEQVKSRMYQDIPKETVDHELAQISEFKQLELEMNEFEATYGFLPSVDMDIDHVERTLQDRIEKEKLVISESKEKIHHLEATEKQLLSEIDSVEKAYNQLEQENITKVKELVTAEDEIIKLQSERVKYSQTFTALNKSKDAHTMVANALSKQGDKQLAHIKQLNEREKNLNNQLICLDRELNSSNAVYDIYKQKREEAKLTLDELKDKTAFSKNKISELQKLTLDKIRLIEEGASTRLRIEESSELLKRKMEATNSSGRPAEAKLKKEREEYRSLLNCSLCRIRLKSHIILKCMHTFCKECLDGKKRCPSCDESFSSIHDVKQFYF